MDTAEDPRVRTVTLQGRAILPDLILTIRQEAIPRGLEVILLLLEAILNHLDLVVILLHPPEVQEATHTHPHLMQTQVLQAVLILD